MNSSHFQYFIYVFLQLVAQVVLFAVCFVNFRVYDLIFTHDRDQIVLQALVFPHLCVQLARHANNLFICPVDLYAKGCQFLFFVFYYVIGLVESRVLFYKLTIEFFDSMMRFEKMDPIREKNLKRKFQAC